MIDRDRGGSWPNRRRSNTGIIRNYSVASTYKIN